jgi:hypothetical protein
MVRKCHRERGEGRIGLIVAVLLAAVAIYLGLKIIPLKIALFEFSDKIEQKLQRASWRSYEQAKLETMQFVKDQAAYTGYPVEHLKVSMPPPVTGEMVVVVDWDIPLDLAVTQYTWKYHVEKRAPMLGRGGAAF